MILNGSVSYEDLKQMNLLELIKIHNTVIKLEKKRDKLLNKQFNSQKRY
jgi:hypothetical protein